MLPTQISKLNKKNEGRRSESVEQLSRLGGWNSYLNNNNNNNNINCKKKKNDNYNNNKNSDNTDDNDNNNNNNNIYNYK